MERQYTASCYVIDFQNKEILLMFNKKLEKWLQPGGHIEGLETPIETAIRETYEETGINIKIIGPHYFKDDYQPIAVERYKNKVGDMIDIQYLGIPLNKEINYNQEKNHVKWINIDNLDNIKNIDQEIKTKVKTLYKKYK